jgi:hypothetical protein
LTVPHEGEGTDDWAFGHGGFAKLYGDRLAHSSLLDTAVATRWIFVYILAQADSHGRFRCATVAGLARAANVAVEDAERAVRELETPDPDSTTKDHEGRRLLRIPGGWQIANYARYRSYQSPRQRAEAERKRRQREDAAAKRQEREEALARREAELKRHESGHVPGHPRDGRGSPPQTSDVKRQTTERTKQRIAASPPLWSSEACELWVRRFNGTAPGGRIGKALGPLVKEHGWQMVRAAWVSYLEQAEAEYASSERFAATFGRWSGSAPPAKSKPAGVIEKNQAVLARFVKEGKA